VVIRCLNEEEHIGRLLTGLNLQQRRPDQIIVVDSGSTDATLGIARRYDVTIVRIEPEAFSFGRALNLGCEAANGDHIVLMSAHVYPVYDSHLDLLCAPFEDDEVVLTYGRQTGDHRTQFSEARVMAQWFPEKSAARQSHPFCNNANAAIRRAHWLTQPYDETLTGLEDLDWARRAQAAGWAVSYVAEAPVVHVHEETWSAVLNRYRREAIAYNRIVGAGHHALESMWLAVSNTLKDYGSATKEGVLLSNLAAIPRFRAAQFLGAWLGFRGRDGGITDDLKRRFYYPARQSDPALPSVPGQRIEYSNRD
jgi:glycosyltransferase involved in cell wall biosynthesis